MKRSPIKPGTKGLKRSPMARGTSSLKQHKPLQAKSPMKRFGKPIKQSQQATALKSKQRAVTAAEKIIWSKLAALGCIACRKEGRHNTHVSIHHVDGRTKPGCHMLVLPLCGPHHQDDGSGAIAVHPWKTQFEERYGLQLDLVRECMSLIGECDEQESGNATSG